MGAESSGSERRGGAQLVDALGAVGPLLQFVQVCQTGMHYSRQAVRVVDFNEVRADALGVASPYSDLQAARAAAIKLETFARQEDGEGFPYLYGLASVSLWGLLEAAVDDLLVDCLRFPESCADIRLIEGIKGPLLAFGNATQEQRAQFLASEISRHVKADLQTGAGRFEALLRPAGLDGPVDDLVGRSLFELSQVRHVTVHRFGVVDHRFQDACPWRAETIGQRLRVTGPDFARYRWSVEWYLFEILGRYCTRYEAESGRDMCQHRTLQSQTLDALYGLAGVARPGNVAGSGLGSPP